jgi:hypothetical protein
MLLPRRWKNSTVKATEKRLILALDASAKKCKHFLVATPLNLTVLQHRKLKRSRAWLGEVIEELKQKPRSGQVLFQVRLLEISATNIGAVLEGDLTLPL